MILEHFDQSRFCATENMARDLAMLEIYPRPDVMRLRHYGWEANCFSFGYSQHFEWIKGQAVQGAQLARRPTGGGLVDHRNDWTYALVLPATHPSHHAVALDVYRRVHEAIASAMTTLGRPATLQPEEKEELTLPGMPKRVRGLCFAGAETFDVIDPKTRIKLAGAAMKRNHSGLLMQGSIDRLTTGTLDWDAFREHFLRNLAILFGATETKLVEAPDYPADELAAIIEKLSSQHWNEHR